MRFPLVCYLEFLRSLLKKSLVGLICYLTLEYN